MKKFLNQNVYTNDLRAIKDPDTAWSLGEELFCATYKNEYAVLDKELIFSFLKKTAECQDENGNIVLYKEEYMPSDTRVGVIYKPTYATTVVAIYAFNYYESDFNESLMTFFKKLLNAFDGIKGHGFDAADTICETMEMLSVNYVKTFLNKYPEISRALNSTIENFVKEFRNVLSRGDDVFHGFGNTPVNARLQKIVSFWDGKDTPVFVYGTLRKGESAHHLLADSDYCGVFALENCAMFDLGNFPGIKRRTGEHVIGEVYFTNKETLEKLDAYEGEGTLYKRNLAQAVNNSAKIVCNVYFYRGEVDECDLMREPWNSKKDEYVWYAGYGSNLSEERFSCYIKGGICSNNGVRYNGCLDKSDWVDTKTKNFKGRMYFGNTSRSWGGKGVAFYDEKSEGTVHMKMYKITREQLEDIQIQEGASENWYGRRVFLGFDKDGCEIYTLTSENLRPENAPAPEYLEIIKKSLKKEFNFTEKYILSYI